MKLWSTVKSKMLAYPFQTIGEGETKLSYQELIAVTEQFAAALSGIQCCAILCESEMMAARALLSCFAAGVTAVPLSKRYGGLHCKKILDKIRPGALICDDSGILTIKNLSDSRYKKPEISPALIMCTSGTTGTPKGVMLTEDNILTNVSDIAEYFTIEERDIILISRPLYHCAVLTGEFLTALVRGTKIRFYSEPFNPPKIPEIIRKYGITVFCGTPTLLGLISRFMRNDSERSLRHIAISGECMSRDVGHRIAETFPQAKIYHVYGLTEACPRVSYLPPILFKTYPDCVGIPLRSVDTMIVKENGTAADINEKGMLYIRGGSIMAGYYNDPVKTGDILSDGWLCTGDIAAFNSVGLLKIYGRKDELIIKAGMNIYPQEIEEALKKDRRVHEALAYGYETHNGIQIGLKIAGNFTSLSDVKRLCFELLPKYQIPTKIELLPELEKNSSGKIKRGGNYA